MKKRGLHDDDGKKLLAAYQRGEFRPVKDQKGAK
jgi:hypothetical protein